MPPPTRDVDPGVNFDAVSNVSAVTNLSSGSPPDFADYTYLSAGTIIDAAHPGVSSCSADDCGNDDSSFEDELAEGDRGVREIHLRRSALNGKEAALGSDAARLGFQPPAASSNRDDDSRGGSDSRGKPWGKKPPLERRTLRGRLLLLLPLLLAAFFGLKSLLPGHSGTAAIKARADASAPATRAIEALHVGQRVLSRNPASSRPLRAGETAVSSATWRDLLLRAEVRAPNGDNDRLEVETLQPPEWVAAHRACRGASVPLPLDLTEMGLPASLRAVVVASLPCPAIQAGDGRVILTTVSHMSNCVCRLTVENGQGARETIQPTAFHKFYREPECKWVSAAALQPGDRLGGRSGALKVVAISRDPGVQRVYNMTVEGEHVYYVSPLGLLAHNNCEIDVGEGGAGEATPAGNASDGRGGSYGHLEDGPSFGSGKDFTAAQKRNILAENQIRNGGVLRDDVTGEVGQAPKQSQKGVTPPENEVHVDHYYPKSEGGPNSYGNAELRLRKYNLEKSDSIP